MSIPTARFVEQTMSASAIEVLRPLSRVLLDDLDNLTDRLTQMILKREPSYAELTGTGRENLRCTFRNNIERGLQFLSADVTEDADPAINSRETGRLRALQGVPLEAALRAYRLAGRVIWESLLAASRDHFGGAYDSGLLDAATEIWRLIDNSSAEMASAYRLEEERLSSQKLSRKHAFLNALLEGPADDPALIREAAGALGLPETGALLCVVALVDSPRDEPLRSPEDILSVHSIASSWHFRPTDIVGLVSLEDRTPDSVLEALSPAVAGPAGVSPVIDELAEAATAYEMARTAARTRRRPGLFRLDDQLPEALLIGSPKLADRLPHIALAGLLALPQQERKTMLTTLDALLVCNGSATHAAQRLYCHRNTVLYRLQRIEAETGRKLAEPRDRLILALGLMALRLQRPGFPCES